MSTKTPRVRPPITPLISTGHLNRREDGYKNTSKHIPNK